MALGDSKIGRIYKKKLSWLYRCIEDNCKEDSADKERNSSLAHLHPIPKTLAASLKLSPKR